MSAYAAGSPGPASDEVDALLAQADAQTADRTRRWLDDPPQNIAQHLVGYAIVCCCAFWPIWVFASVRPSSVTSPI